MNDVDTVHLPPVGDASRLQNRLSGLAVLVAVLGLAGWVLFQAVLAFTDAWVAPILLAPTNDAVLQLRVGLNRQLAELARVDAESRRIQEDLLAVDAAVERLSKLRHHGRLSLRWQAGTQQEEGLAVGGIIGHLREERGLLTRLHERQSKLTERSRDDLKAGLVDRTEVERQEQAVDALARSLLENQRMLDEAGLRQRQLTNSSTALKAAFGATDVRGRSPEVAQAEEHEARLELELLKLEAEKRGLAEILRVTHEAVARQTEALEEIRRRPLYRAMVESTDVAFVPYSQLASVEAGARVYACDWGVVRCHEVGTIDEVLEGEVITQDPWGNVARGQYALLNLVEPSAIREKVLRVRRD